MARVGSKCLKCHACSSPSTETSATAGSRSSEKISLMPSSKITSNNARPNTGDGFASGNCSATMMSNRNGSVAESAGSWTERFAGSVILPNRFGARVPGSIKRQHAQLTATKKKIAKQASMSSAVGNPLSSVGIRSSHAPTATRVSTSTATTGNRVAVATARTIARTSIINTNGHTSSESPVSRKIGISTSRRASAGKM